MTVAVAVTLVIAAAGGCRWIWTRRASGPQLRVEGWATWIPDAFRVPCPPGMMRWELGVYEIVVRNAGESDAVIEEWGIEARSGAVLYPSADDWERALLRKPLSCRVPCRARAHDPAHRWYLPASDLAEWCSDERVWIEDVRPWVRRASDGKIIRARRWGLPGDEADDPGRTRWAARLLGGQAAAVKSDDLNVVRVEPQRESLFLFRAYGRP